MGFLIAETHISFISLFTPINPELPKIWGLKGIIAGAILWLLIWLIFFIASSRLFPYISGAHPAFEEEYKILSNLIDEVAIAAGEPTYKIYPYILEIDKPNAFACGKSTKKGAIVVTRGLIDILDRDELRAVLAHEFAHLKNGDSMFTIQALSFCWSLLFVSMGAYYVVLLAFFLIFLVAFFFFKIAESSEGSDAEGCVTAGISLLIGIGLIVVGIFYLSIYVLLLLLTLFLVGIGIKGSSSSISKSREYLADACSAQWTRDPMALASALDKIRYHDFLSFKNALLSPLWIHSPSFSNVKFVDRLFTYLFETHPLIENRIKRVIEMGGSYAQIDVKMKEILKSLKPSFFKRLGELIYPVLSTLLALLIFFGVFSTFNKIPIYGKAQKPYQQELAPLYAVIVEKPIINLRDGPGLSYPILAKIKKGEKLLVYKEENDWLFVEYRNLKGWVTRKIVRKEF